MERHSTHSTHITQHTAYSTQTHTHTHANTSTHLVGRVGGELLCHDDVAGQEELHLLVLADLLQLGGQGQLVVLDQGLADAQATGLKEGEDHAAAQDELVHLGKHGLDDGDLGRDLGAAHDGGKGPLGNVHGALQVVELLLQQEAGHGGRQEGGDASGGPVRAVRRAEGVVDKEVGVHGELLGELLVVGLLLRVEAGVLQQHHVAVLHLSNGLAHGHADAVGNQRHGHAQELREAGGDGGQGELGLVAALGATQVGGQQHLGALAHQVLDGRHGSADARVVRDPVGALFDRHVQVHADEHTLALQVRLSEVAHGLLGHGQRARQAAHGGCAEGEWGGSVENRLGGWAKLAYASACGPLWRN